MKRLALAALLAIFAAVPALAGGFDCLNPPFGQKLADLEYAEHFVKYAEKGGVAYYNYTGPRIPDPAREIASPRVSYGFVEGRLYTLIFQNSDVPKGKVMEMIRSAYGMTPRHAYDEGDWSVFVWNAPERKLDFKLKFNNATSEMKAAFYYLPLKERLKR